MQANVYEYLRDNVESHDRQKQMVDILVEISVDRVG